MAYKTEYVTTLEVISLFTVGTTNADYQRITRGLLDPSNPLSVAAYLERYGTPEVHAVLDAARRQRQALSNQTKRRIRGFLGKPRRSGNVVRAVVPS